MANENGWGDGVLNNTIGWGQGSDNEIGWGSIYSASDAGLTALEDSGGFDPDADAFIAAHEAETGSPMGEVQKATVNATFLLLKGGNAEGLNILSKIKRWACYCPIDNDTANAAAYSVDLVEPSVLNTFTGFLAENFNVLGLIGGAGKHLDMQFNPVARGSSITNFAYGWDATTIITATVNPMGLRNGGAQYTATTYLGGRLLTGVAEALNTARVTYPNIPSGFTQVTVSANVKKVYNLGVEIDTVSRTGTSFVNDDIYCHASNNVGTPAANDSRRFRGFAITDGLTATEAAALSECWSYFQNNIITGGR